MIQTLKVLITVKTYPHPSEKYHELVCTAGVLEDGSFIRLYPLDYRYRAYLEQFKKYQWVEIKVEKNPKDTRVESFRPIMSETIVPLGPVVDTKKKWEKRKKIIFQHGMKTMCELEKMSQEEQSLGIIRPRTVNDFIIKPITPKWKPKWMTLFTQQDLFEPAQKPLEKIPYKFSYKFTCEDENCRGHTKMIEDWEVCELYRRMRDQYDDEVVVLEKVKQKFLDIMCADDVDTHFFVGTVLKHGSWIILGVFWPKK